MARDAEVLPSGHLQADKQRDQQRDVECGQRTQDGPQSLLHEREFVLRLINGCVTAIELMHVVAAL